MVLGISGELGGDNVVLAVGAGVSSVGGCSPVIRCAGCESTLVGRVFSRAGGSGDCLIRTRFA